MPDYLPQKMGYLRNQWPGMNPREIVVFNNWLGRHYVEYTGFDFNVRCGKGVDPGPVYTDDERSQYVANTQKRIDALAWQDTQPTIIEVKDRAGLSAIGQILGYFRLWRNDNPQSIVPKMLLVYNNADVDVIHVAQASGVSVEQVLSNFDGLKKTPFS